VNSLQLRYGKLCCAKASTKLILFLTEISLSVSVTEILSVIVQAMNSGYEF